MDIQKAKNIYSKLGGELLLTAEKIEHSAYYGDINSAIIQNPWFTMESIQLAFKSLGLALQAEKIETWLNNYTEKSTNPAKNIGIVMAGNIPLVGFHDLICTLVSGNNAIAKLSYKDQILYKVIKEILVKIDTSFDSRISFVENTLQDIDAIIATGSDNSSRYFEYYFSKYPNIIRKNRNSVAIITGAETHEDFERLGYDIFTYYGLGCRNVSNLLVPVNYIFEPMLLAFEKYNPVIQHNKYANNYSYQKTILSMNRVSHLDNGFVLLKEDRQLASPIAVINYIYYKELSDVDTFFEANEHKIQCAVSKTNWSFHTYRLGEAQQPELWDYADNVDTLNFLLNLK